MHGDPHELPSADFRGRLLLLRGRAGLSQRELAALTGTSERAIQSWESGLSHPTADRLKALIAVYLRRGVFAPGREQEEVVAFWEAAREEASRLQAPFDHAWFATLRASALAAPPPAEVAAGPGAASSLRVAPLVAGGQDWGEAPDLGTFHGRADELATLTDWALVDGCRLVAILGMGGNGKTALAARLARELAPHFDSVYWRSLRNAPPCAEWLAGAILFLSGQQVRPAEGEEARLRQLLELLRARRSLLVLDNLETVLEPGAPTVRYREGYDAYGQVLQVIGETGHQSCLVLTGREQPPELRARAGAQAPVRALRLGGMDAAVGRALLADIGLVGDAAAWGALVGRYAGNALALLVVGETIRAVFGGEIAPFLQQGEAVFGDIRWLLDGHLARLSAVERAVLDWLAVEREPIEFGRLVANLGPDTPRGEILEAVEALGRRSLLERGEQGATFTLQPVVLEYATEQLIDVAAGEILGNEPALLVRQPLVKAQARDYVRRSQERLVATPVLERLAAVDPGGAGDARLLALLERWRARPPAEQGYGPGNVVNLLRLRRGELRGVDLSRLWLRQVYLPAVDAHDGSLAGAHLVEAVLAEPFDHAVATAVSADGQYLAAGTLNGEVRLWRVADRTPVLTVVAGHAGTVWGVALSGDGQLVASGGGDGLVRLWRAPSGRLLAVLEADAAGVVSVALSADGQVVASGVGDGTARVWDVPSGQRLAVLEGHPTGVVSVALSADGQLAATGGGDGTVRLWEVPSGRCLATLEGDTAGFVSVALSADGQLVASGGWDGTVRLWDAASGQCVAVLKGHAAGVVWVALSAAAQLVASGGGDRAVRLWDTASGRCLAVLEGHTAPVRSVALSAAGQLLATSGADRTVRLWEAPSGRSLAVLEGQTAGVVWVALSADGQLVASAGWDRTIRLWDAASGQCLAVLAGHTAGITSVAVSADKQLVASSGGDGAVRLWDALSGRCLAVLEGHTAGVWGVALSAAARLVASGGEDRTVRLWDVPSGRCRAVLEGHIAAVRSVALSAAGHHLASGGRDGTVRLWDVPSGQCVAVLEGHTAGVWGVALSADGQLVASGGGDGTVRLWEAPSGRCVAVLEGHTAGVWSVALSADGRLAASSGWDRTVCLWEAPSGRPLVVLEAETAGVMSVALSASGQLVAGGGDGMVRLWPVPSGAPGRTLRPDRVYERLDITGLTGVTDAQREALLALGAVEHSGRATGS
jgi:WD40 repeat protein/transcriptional regulator with XRE-family HTH domain